MEHSGLCAVCGKVALPTYSCRFCGAIVCAEHFDKRTGLCSECASRVKPNNK